MNENTMSSSVGGILADPSEYWKGIIGNCYPDLVRFSRRLTGNAADAEDVAQEAVCRLLKYAKRPEKVKSPLHYLFAVARHVYFDSKKEAYLSEVSLDHGHDEGRHSEFVVDSNILDRLHYQELYKSLPLRVFLAGLSEYEIKLLRLKVIEEMNVRQIAKTVDRDANEIRYDLNKMLAKIRYRARKIIKECI